MTHTWSNTDTKLFYEIFGASIEMNLGDLKLNHGALSQEDIERHIQEFIDQHDIHATINISEVAERLNT